MTDRASRTKDWYKEYHRKVGSDRNNLRTNRGVLMQAIASEISVVRAFYAIEQNPSEFEVLDVGCGGGGDLYQLLRMGVRPERVTGIDIVADHIENARRVYPHIKFIEADATAMEFGDNAFDLIFESTMFATLPDDEVSSGIASEMVRVCKPGGYIMLVDWRIPKPRDASYKALTGGRLRSMFGVGDDTDLLGVYRGSLVPPLGRFLSKRWPSGYFLVSAVFPFLVGQVVYLLRKR